MTSSHPLVEHVYEDLKKSVSEIKEKKLVGITQNLNLGIIEIDGIPIETMFLIIDCCNHLKRTTFGLKIRLKVLSNRSVFLEIDEIETDGTLLISKDEVEKVLNKIKKLKYNHAKGFHFPEKELYPFERRQIVSASFFKDDNIKTVFMECIVCTETTKSRLKCCGKTLCVRCACKSSNENRLRCPHCRKEGTFVYYNDTYLEYNDDRTDPYDDDDDGTDPEYNDD